MPLLIQFFRLCLLKVGPQDLPASSFLLILCSAAYVISGAFGASWYYEWHKAAQIILANTVLLVLFANGALAVRGYPRRSTQTMIALLGVGVIFNLLVLMGQALALPNALLLLLMLWNVIVFASIMRHALDIPFMFGLGITCFYIFISMGVTASIAADKVG